MNLPENRILVLAPTGMDAKNSVTVLTAAGLACAVCRDMRDLCKEAARGGAVIILTEEALALERASSLAEFLHGQEPWSDLPIIVLTRGGPESPSANKAVQTLGNVFLLERPVRIFSLVTAAKTAFRAREKQYQIRAHLRDLKEADAKKDEFLATLAHELRNPLAPVRTGLQLLRLSGLTDGAGRTRDMMERQVSHMVRLIDDLMDVSRITRGKVDLRRENLDVRYVFDCALESSRPLIDAAKHRFTVSIPDEPIRLYGDATRLAQVVSNLLNNAAKYTPDGGEIELSASIETEQAVIRVKDNGVGIPAVMIPKIFEMFTQVGRSIDRSKGGLGIGLTIVQRLVEMHGGTISVESSGEGLGSLFEVRLPLAVRAPYRCSKTFDVDNTTESRALRVMVVDDNIDGAESLASLLQLSGYTLRTAHTGQAALETARIFQPQVVLLDIGLPGMNGYEVARSLREGTAKPVLVALTGWASEGDRLLAKNAGFDYHLTKPADTMAIQNLLKEVCI